MTTSTDFSNSVRQIKLNQAREAFDLMTPSDQATLIHWVDVASRVPTDGVSADIVRSNFVDRVNDPRFKTITILQSRYVDMKDCIETGLEHTQGCLIDHDVALGRTTRKNQLWAETLERDIEKMKDQLSFMNGEVNPKCSVVPNS